jgi:hypothetical protein
MSSSFSKITDQNWINAILEKFPSRNRVWSNFNCDLRRWRQLKERYFDTEMIATDLLPDMPVISEYTDLVAPKTNCNDNNIVFISYQWTAPQIYGTEALRTVDQTEFLITEHGGRFYTNYPPGSEDSYYIGGYDGPKQEWDMAKLEECISALPNGKYYCQDWEDTEASNSPYKFDIRHHSESEVNATIAKLIQFKNDVKSINSSIKFGNYYSPILREFYTPINYYLSKAIVEGEELITNYPDYPQDIGWHAANLANYTPAFNAWQAANDFLQPLAAEMDYLAPSLYKFTPNQEKYYILGNMIEAVRTSRAVGNIPIYPFYWNQYHGGAGPTGIIPLNLFEVDLQLIKDGGANGVILWDMVNSSGANPLFDAYFESAKRIL